MIRRIKVARIIRRRSISWHGTGTSIKVAGLN